MKPIWCEIHRTLLTQPWEGEPYCDHCLGIEREPDWDLIGKYGGRNDSHLDDPGATALVGGGWWKGLR